MTVSASRPAKQSASPGHLWWLPPGGCGNGLDDAAWAPILEVALMPRLAREAARCDDSAWR